MKKTYMAPQTNEVNVMAESMIAASFRTFNTTVNTQEEGVQLGKRGQWGNLWAK